MSNEYVSALCDAFGTGQVIDTLHPKQIDDDRLRSLWRSAEEAIYAVKEYLKVDALSEWNMRKKAPS